MGQNSGANRRRRGEYPVGGVAGIGLNDPRRQQYIMWSNYHLPIRLRSAAVCAARMGHRTTSRTSTGVTSEHMACHGVIWLTDKLLNMAYGQQLTGRTASIGQIVAELNSELASGYARAFELLRRFPSPRRVRWNNSLIGQVLTDPLIFIRPRKYFRARYIA
jgi:hypothetical protein